MKNRAFHIELLSLLALILCLPLSSCKKSTDNELERPKPQLVGSTYFNLSLSLEQTLRAATEEDKDTHNPLGYWNGRDSIQRFDAFLISNDGKIEHIVETSPKRITTAGSSQTPTYTLMAPRLTTPGTKTLYVFVNFPASSPLLRKLEAAKSASELERICHEPMEVTKAGSTFGAHYAIDPQLAKTVKKDAQLYDLVAMTARPVTIEVVDGVSETDAVGHPKNEARMELRRLFGRTLLTQSFSEEKDPSKAVYEVRMKYPNKEGEMPKDKDRLVFTLKDFSYTVMQMDKKTYPLWQDKDKKPTLLHRFTVSPSYGYIPIDESNYYIATDHYAYPSSPEKRIPYFNRVGSSESQQLEQIAQAHPYMFYVSETTHPYGAALDATSAAEQSGYRKGNTAYVLIRAKIEPDKSMYGLRKFYGEEPVPDLPTADLPPDHDLYFGLVDGKFYVTERAASYNNTSWGTNISPKPPHNPLRVSPAPSYFITFKKQYCYYTVWLNPDKVDPAEWVNSPVLRNNLYHINIKGFNTLGYTGNPFEPDREDHPSDHPLDPNDRVPTPDEPLYNKDREMVNTEVSILKWQVKKTSVEI